MMFLIYLSIPVMVLAVAIATAPLVWAMSRERSWHSSSGARFPQHRPSGARDRHGGPVPAVLPKRDRRAAAAWQGVGG